MADNGFDLSDLPPEAFDYGFQEGQMRVRANLDLQAVEIGFRGEFEFVLSPVAVIELLRRLTGALARLEARQDRGE